MTHLDLFSGIGGFALASQREGFRTIAFCECDDYAQRTLIKNFGAVMADAINNGHDRQEANASKSCGNKSKDGLSVRDDKALADAERSKRRPPRSKEGNGEGWIDSNGLYGRKEISGGIGTSSPPFIFQDVRTLDGTQFKGVTVLTAGVPCQPASCAGKRRGTTDDRWLWPEALRILREAMPAYAVFENPRGILSLEGGLVFERLFAEMESYGYSVQPIIIPACAVDAKHRRDRVWIIANRSSDGRRAGRSGRLDSGGQGKQEQSLQTFPNGNRTRPQGRLGRKLQERPYERIARTSNPPVADSANGSNKRSRTPRNVGRLENEIRAEGGNSCHWLPEPNVGRVAYGVPSRVDRLKCLGNAIVPQVAQIILRAIKQSILTTSKV